MPYSNKSMVLVNLKQEYFHLLLFFLLSITMSTQLCLLTRTTRPSKDTPEKLSAYECGFDPFASGVSSFEVHFYVVGVLFIIFDLEIVFLYP